MGKGTQATVEACIIFAWHAACVSWYGMVHLDLESNDIETSASAVYVEGTIANMC